jgi:hypothetical protein
MNLVPAVERRWTESGSTGNMASWHLVHEPHRWSRRLPICESAVGRLG